MVTSVFKLSCDFLFCLQSLRIVPCHKLQTKREIVEETSLRAMKAPESLFIVAALLLMLVKSIFGCILTNQKRSSDLSTLAKDHNLIHSVKRRPDWDELHQHVAGYKCSWVVRTDNRELVARVGEIKRNAHLSHNPSLVKHRRSAYGITSTELPFRKRPLTSLDIPLGVISRLLESTRKAEKRSKAQKQSLINRKKMEIIG